MSIPPMTAGVTPAGEGLEGVAWNILGQTYRPVALTESAFAFDTLFPPGTFVPPHIHPLQDEFIRVLEGNFELVLDGQAGAAGPGDLIRLPRGQSHGIFNRSAAPVRALFWVSPARSLYELFARLHDLTDPNEVVRIAAEHEVTFLPPQG
ncbi:cupin domain-containing protein [Roseomonas sp. NAR14]|uniref:Cupin domain-containing protein n=1 Tax=Roseomonas acroporae TaxID=2937791 RepID=A0A9X1Y7G8_9PROT|nr:cupin domain-containing protein [Roseomonas acroporae]MCK8783635.1 cupin domain-containing protein [Roseomonas acroporae]